MSKAIILWMSGEDVYDLSGGYSDFAFPLRNVGKGTKWKGKKLRIKKAIKAYIYLGTRFTDESFGCFEWYEDHAYKIVGSCVLQEALPHCDGQVFRLRGFRFFPEKDMPRLWDVRRPSTIIDKILGRRPETPSPSPWDWIEWQGGIK